MHAKLFTATLLLIISQGAASLRAQNGGGTMMIKGSVTKLSSSLSDFKSIMAITEKNVAGKQHDVITIVKERDASSPQLLKASTSNEVLQQVVFKVTNPGDATKYKLITLTNAIITKITPVKGSATHNDTHEQEEISFTFGKIEISYIKGGVTATDDWDTGK